MRNPLFDLAFLKELDLLKHKEIYAKIILLSFQEEPKYEIQGRITSGSINIDRASAVRRTCSLSMITEQGVIESNYWGMENKFKLEVGIKNTIDDRYPDIIWFKQGVFVITSLSETISINAHNISISGKDKMCLLNGDIGGNLTAIATDFGQIDEEEWGGGYTNAYITSETYEVGKYYIKIDDDTYELCEEEYDEDIDYYEKNIVVTTTRLPIFEIIKNMLLTYGKELPHNIVINDIDKYGLELLEYRGDSPLYLIKNTASDVITNLTFNGNQKYYLNKNCTNEVKLNEDDRINYDYLVTQVQVIEPTKVYASTKGKVEEYTIIKLEYGDTAGYRKTDLVYPTELVGELGDTVITILDKIKVLFGNFEYFYDLDGRFIFQKKPYTENISWNPLKTSEDGVVYSTDSMYETSIAYSFDSINQITNINYQPKIANIKNDYSIWGKRKTISGAERPIHLRYAIQEKPYYYKAIRGEEENTDRVYYSENCPSSLLNRSDDNIKCDWREIIYQMSVDYLKYSKTSDDFLHLIAENNSMYPSGITGYEDFYIDMQGFWRDLYNPSDTPSEQYDRETHWNKALMEAPETLDFWIDFLDTDSEYGQYSISRIGSRTKTLNNDKIQAIYFREVPNILIIENSEYEELVETPENYLELQGYTFIKFPENFDQYFTISSQGLSAWDEFNNLLYKHTNYAENITLTTFPIYYLQPNNKISLNVNDNNKINGEYLINKLTIPLGTGTGSISGTKVIKRIY